ncbi:DELTA-thalatoxin-Avl2a-like isoform X2 [Oculina patagonica]
MFTPVVLLICLTVISISTGAPSKTEELGKVVDLRGTNLLDDFQERETTIFEPIDSGCFIDETKGIKASRKFMQYYENSNSFYSSLATQSELDASLQSSYTLGVTLNVATKSKSSKEHKVSGMSLNALAVNEKIVVKRGCLESEDTTLKKSFLEDLESLPLTINAPWKSNSWEAYHSFLRKYGSHVITSVTLGSSFRQMTFAESDKSYSEREFEVKSCISVAGDTPAGQASFKGCTDITSEEKKTASSMSTSDKVFVLGGTAETRNKLLDQETRSVEAIQQLLNEAPKSPASIEHTFYALWNVLQGRFKPQSANHIRGLNLEYYYLGFLNYGCPYQEGGGVAFQKFDYTKSSTKTSPAFECSLAKEGCHSNNDCHYHVGVWCSCRGSSCVRYKTETQENGSKKEVAYAQTSDWAWHGCDWKTWGSYCTCQQSKERKTVWSRPSKDAPAHKARHHGNHHKAKDQGHRKPKRKEE